LAQLGALDARVDEDHPRPLGDGDGQSLDRVPDGLGDPVQVTRASAGDHPVGRSEVQFAGGRRAPELGRHVARQQAVEHTVSILVTTA
jgi:hypothetical protein